MCHFLSVCGSTTYQLIHSLVAPGNPADKKLAVLIKLVEGYVSLPLSNIVQPDLSLLPLAEMPKDVPVPGDLI